MRTRKNVCPLIGITCSRVTGGAWGAYSLGHFMDYTFSDYSQAILNAGGAPVILPAAQDPKSLERILGAVEGLILSGGPDIHPRRYGEEPLAGLGEVDETLDPPRATRPSTRTPSGSRPAAICAGLWASRRSG